MLQFKKICTWVLAGALAFSVAGCQQCGRASDESYEDFHGDRNSGMEECGP